MSRKKIKLKTKNKVKKGENMKRLIDKDTKTGNIQIDIRGEKVAYITIGNWVIYVDNSTGEQIIDSWEE